MVYVIHAGKSGGDDRDDIILIAVLVPILSVLLLVALLVPVTVGGWRLWAKRFALILTSYPDTLLHPHTHCINKPQDNDYWKLEESLDMKAI